MLLSLQLYGPHHGAQWSDNDVALGRRLMKVLPEDAFDQQPLIGTEGRYILVADVRLDNRDELTKALSIPVPQARTLSDSAILLAAIERWDESCFEHLVGDYAFAAWDSMRRRLLLARDPLGLRPLHYHRGDRFFAFASMPKGLHALPDVPYALDEERIVEFLMSIPQTGTQSFFLGIERVEPGHVVVVTPNGLAARRHWNPKRQRLSLRRPEEYSDALRDLLEQAVSCRLRGTGDVGAYLSGGLDSGAVAATAARLLAPSGRQVIALTGVPRIDYDRSASKAITDEGPNAAATAALYPNMEHVLIHNKGCSPLANLDRTFALLEQPGRGIDVTGWTKSFETVIRQRKLKVILGGGFGNIGLSYDGVELLPELFRTGQWLRLWSEASALVASRQMRWRGVLANTFGPWCPLTLWTWVNKIGRQDALRFTDYCAIHPTRLQKLDLRGRAKKHNKDLSFRPWKDAFELRLQLLQLTDPGNHHKLGLGALQVDYRDPTADVRLLEFCLAVPTDQFLRDGMTRALARRALADRLPKQVLEERRRALQGADWHKDFEAARDDIVAELDRLEACPTAAAFLDLPRLRRLTENWPSGGWERRQIEVPYRYAMLRAIATGHFVRRATGSNG
jgi:asparagine synthase (glutamine-hydrolysing)